MFNPSFSISEAIQVSFSQAKVHFGRLWLPSLLYCLVLSTEQMIGLILPKSKELFYGIAVTAGALTFVMDIGLISIAMKLIRTEPTETFEVMTFGKYILPVFGWSALIGIPAIVLVLGSLKIWPPMVVLPILALIVLSARISYMPYIVAERRTTVWEGFVESFRITKGHVLKICCLYVCEILLFVGGVMLLGVGLIFTLPMTIIMQLHVYRWLQTQRT